VVEAPVTTAPGDLMLIYSDGLTEAENANEDMLGEAGTKAPETGTRTAGAGTFRVHFRFAGYVYFAPKSKRRYYLHPCSTDVIETRYGSALSPIGRQACVRRMTW
jgi:hypothetical protein